MSDKPETPDELLALRLTPAEIEALREDLKQAAALGKELIAADKRRDEPPSSD
jgi:hypothetical protein